MLSIKIPEHERQNETISERYLYAIKQQIKRDSYHWYKTMREGNHEYVHEFRERVSEILFLQKKHHQIIDNNEHNPPVQQTSLAELHNFHSGKSFKEMTKVDIVSYLATLRKSLVEDPYQRWIGSYNGRQMILTKFFRWLYNPNESDQRKRITPPCVQGVKKLPRKEKTRYKHVDMWDTREHAIFLKYCPDKRDRCYHAMAIDTSVLNDTNSGILLQYQLG